VPPPQSNEPYVDLNDLPTFEIDACMRPYFHVTGVATEVSKAEATFEVNVEQYISCAKSDPSATSSLDRSKPTTRSKLTTRFFCHIPDSPKYRSGKPMPAKNRWVTIYGYVTGVDMSSDNTEVEQFRMNIENIAFCGPYIPPANSAASVRDS
jgi:protein tyrosine/serine phosphatase